MKTFRELLDPVPGVEPGEVQRRAAGRLPERLMHSAMDWWPPDAVPHGPGSRLLVGVAVWSRHDLRLLDVLDDAVRDGRGSGIPVGVFDLDRFSSPGELERLLPGVGAVYQSPAAGYWVAGELKEQATGFAARQLVARLFGLDPDVLAERPTPAPRVV